MPILRRYEAFIVTGLAAFPLLGNAAGLVLALPRRSIQAALLLVCCGLLVVSGSVAAHSIVMRRLRGALIVGGSLVVLPAALGLGAGHQPTRYAVIAAGLTAAWLTLLIYHLTGRWTGAVIAPARDTPVHRGFGAVFVAMLALLVCTAYLTGPDPGEPTMAFRGSTTLAGTSAAVLAAIALAALQGWQRFVGMLLSVYLNFVAASRAGLLVLLALTGIVLVMRAAHERGLLPAGRSLMKDLALVTACAALVVLPALSAHLYPYASSRPAPAGAHVQYKDHLLTDREGLAFRYRRLLRLVRPPVMVADLPPPEIRRMDEEGIAESRWLMVQRTLRAIAAGPLGYWPQPFASQTRIYCGRPELCEYPHNLSLEVGYHVGWLGLGAMIVGLAALGARAIMTVMHPDILVRVSSIGFLGHLGYAQVSGNLLDHSLALLLGIVWTARGAHSDSEQRTVGA